jgi:hypothetical protein
MANGQTGKPKPRVANRLYIGTDGKPVKEPDEAVGVRYERLGANGVILWTVEVADVTKIHPDGQKLLALFGAKTWIGNLDNQDDAHDEILAKVATVTDKGEWPEREGNVGPRYDFDKLAPIILDFKLKDDPSSNATLEAILKRLNSEKGYPAMAMRVPDVATAYHAATGKAATIKAL